jgi:transcription initiation factor TFIIB
MITITIDRCPNCRAESSILTDFTSGQVACSNCGIVLDDRIIDETSEWRNFSGDSSGSGSADPNRVGGPINPFLDDNSLSTAISTKNNTGTLSRWKFRSLGSGNRSLMRGFKKLEDFSFKLDLHNIIVDKSKDTLKKIEESKKLKGRSLDCVLAAVIFHACRQCQAPRTIKEIISTLNLNKKDVSRCYNSIKKIICTPNDVPIINSTIGLVSTYCNKLEVTNEIKKASIDIAEEVCKREIIAGRNPSTVATAAITFALRLYDSMKTSKRDIAEISKVTENTTNSAFSLLVEHKIDICPKYLVKFLDRIKNN